MIISFASKLIIQLLETVNLDINELSTYSPTEYFRTKIYVSLVLSIIFAMQQFLEFLLLIFIRILFLANSLIARCYA